MSKKWEAVHRHLSGGFLLIQHVGVELACRDHAVPVTQQQVDENTVARGEELKSAIEDNLLSLHEAIGDAENPLAAITALEAIDDDANALAAFEEIHCWTHWLMLFGALVTIVYGLGVLYARRHSARDMDDFEDHIMGRKREEQAVESRVSNGAFQAM